MTLENICDQLLSLQNTPLPSPLPYIRENFEPEGTVFVNLKPSSPVHIMRIRATVDDLILFCPFEQSHLYQKIHRFLYVPARKENDDYFVLPCSVIDLDMGLKRLLEADYKNVCSAVRRNMVIQPYNGRFLQLRPCKGGRIFSDYLGTNVSTTNYAFYLTPNFIQIATK